MKFSQRNYENLTYPNTTPNIPSSQITVCIRGGLSLTTIQLGIKGGLIRSIKM